jgi:hypothetical protein
MCVIAVIAIVIAATGAISCGRIWLHETKEYMMYGYVLPENVERRVAVIDDERVSFLVVHLPSTMTWFLANDPSSPKTVREWKDSFHASLVLNGSYFTEDHEPAGYYAIDGVQSGKAECPTGDRLGYTFGVAMKEKKLVMTYIPDLSEAFCSEYLTGFASFPTLVRNDVSTIETDSGLKARRTMMAQTMDGKQQILITESGETTLYDVAQWLVDQPEIYAIVGNLDGGPSTGLSIHSISGKDVNIPSAAVPNVILGWE